MAGTYPDPDIGTGKIVDADVNASAAIAKTKLASLDVVNADVNASAAIAKSKLAALAIVNADVDAAAAIAESKLSLASDAAAGTASRRTLGTSSTAAAAGDDSRFPAGADIVNADISASAAIAKTKLASLDVVNADVNSAAAIAYSKLNLGTSIVNADVSTSAAIAESKVSGLVNDLAYGAGGPLVPTGITYQTYSRFNSNMAVTGAVLVNGTMKLAAIWLPTGFTVTSIKFRSGTTALITSGSGPHAWAALYNSSLGLLRQSTDDTAATWAATTTKTFTLSSTYQTTYTGLHYLGLMLHAGSTGTLPSVLTLGWPSSATADLAMMAPSLFGSSSSGLTATAPDPAATITVNTAMLYGGVA